MALACSGRCDRGHKAPICIPCMLTIEAIQPSDLFQLLSHQHWADSIYSCMRDNSEISSTRKRPESANLSHTAILKFAESHILCRNYFCLISKFGEDVKPQQYVYYNIHQRGRDNNYKWKIFSTAVLTLYFDFDLSKNYQ